jgi:hypothetical protein
MTRSEQARNSSANDNAGLNIHQFLPVLYENGILFRLNNLRGSLEGPMRPGDLFAAHHWKEIRVFS